jgi:eukaryotic-like serine/threonine-protein kinase
MHENTLHFTDIVGIGQTQTISFFHYDEKDISPMEIAESDFILKNILGEGGMGVVYCAEQQSPKRDVAVKTPKLKNKSIAQLLLREAHLTGKLEHPNIIPIYLVRQKTPSNVEIIMRKLDGQSMQEQVLGNIDLSILLQALVSVCHALEYAHSMNIIHRDIKPENIMMGSYGEVYLMDWGIALDLDKADEFEAVFVGSPAYMAPEMTISTDKITPACDIYLLGSTLHQILTGNPRHMGNTLYDNIELSQSSSPYDYSHKVPKYLGDICNWACQKNPEDRPKDVGEFRKALEGFFNLQEAENYIHAGQGLLKLLQKHASSSEVEEQTLLSEYYQARFAFQQALPFPTHREEAEHGITETKHAMLRIAIQRKELQLATAIVSEVEALPDNLAEEFYILQEMVASKKSEYKKLRTTYDKGIIHKEGKQIGKTLLVSIILLISSVTIYDFYNNAVINGERLLISSGTLAVVINTVLYFNRNLRHNAYHRRLQSTLGFGSVLLVLFALCGAYLDIDGNNIMRTFLGIVGITFANTFPVMRRGWIVGLFCAISIPFSSFFPEFTHPLFMASGLLAASLIYFQYQQVDEKSSNAP